MSSGARPARTRRRSLPVVRWLQVGTVAVGMGLAMAAAPTALADERSPSDPAPTVRSTVAPASHTAAVRGVAAPGGRSIRTAAAKPVAGMPGALATAGRRASVAASNPADAASTSIQSCGAHPSVPVSQTATVGTASAKAVAGTVAPSVGQDSLGKLSAFLGLPWAPANTNPTLASWGLLADMQIRSVLSGSPAPVVTNQTAVITGLFRQLLRRDPTSEELGNYAGIMNLTGVNGAVASLYNSTAFRQGQASTFFQEVFDVIPTADQIGWGATLLLNGIPEPLLEAAIAGTREAYMFSSSQGGPYGVPASASTYVSLLYRNVLGDIAGLEGSGQAYVTRIEAGLPIGLAAVEFATSAAFRSAKIGEIYNALGGPTPTTQQIQQQVGNWFWAGGLGGIATSLLSSAANVGFIQTPVAVGETSVVKIPDPTALQQYTEVLAARYTEADDGFVKLFQRYLKTNPVDGTLCSTNCNQPLLDLIQQGGDFRGMPNNILSDSAVIWANTRDIIPNQNEVDMEKSLKGPLSLDLKPYPNEDPLTTLHTYLAGGQVTTGGGIILTAANGTYVLDGHHRWSTLFCINPNTQIQALDVGYVPNPKEGLAETQISVVNRDSQIRSEFVDGNNLFTVSRSVFDATVRGYIDNNNVNAAAVTFTDPKTGAVTGTVTTTNKDVLLVSFWNVLHAVPNTYAAQSKLYNDPAFSQVMETETVDYLWGNVELMRQYNQPAPDAVSRGYMPQPVGNSYNPYFGPLQSGKVTFTFPIVSYIG